MFSLVLSQKLNRTAIALSLAVTLLSGVSYGSCPDTKSSFAEAKKAMRAFNAEVQPDLVESGTKVWRVRIEEDHCQNKIILADTTPIFGAKAPTKIGNVKVFYRISMSAPSDK